MKTYNNTVCGKGQTFFSLLVLLLACNLTPTVVEAAAHDGNYHMILNGRSIHLSKAPEGKTFNENNIGTGVQYEFNREIGSKWVSYVTGSAFNDSFNNLSYYVGGGEARRYLMRNGWHMDTGYVAFVMARQDINNYQPFLGVLPIMSIGTRKVALNMTYVPHVNEQFQELFFFQLKVSTNSW